MTASSLDVTTREQLAFFIQRLRADLLQNEAEWENNTLDRFLDAMAGWVQDADGLKNNVGIDVDQMSSWTFAAAMLAAAVVYE